MLAIEEAKLPPPNPASPARVSMTQKGVLVSDTAKARPPAGISNNRAETTVQLRPPKRATMKV